MPHQLQLAPIVAFAIVACSVCFQPGQAQSGDLDDNCTLTEFTTLSRKVAQVRHVQSTEFLHVAALRCGIPGQTRTCAPGLGDGCAANRLKPVHHRRRPGVLCGHVGGMSLQALLA